MQELTILESRGSVTTDGGFGSFGGFRVVSSVSSSSSSMPTSSGDGDLFGVVCLLVMLYAFKKTGNDGKVEPENEIFYLNLSFKILSSISEAGPTLC